ncbi:MAG: protoporphyrinogen oxidase HemJ [Magnetospirillum sp.]|nr:protoporphyrinogen oxidase HemJ [Magnetospirillum sp.]
MTGEHYLWLKSLHVMAVISWMAGLLYMPRLFVYHATVKAGSEASETFKVMERRLMNAIMIPAAALSWASGLTMAWSGGLFTEAWFHAKLALVVLLTVSHAMMERWRRGFATDRNAHPQRFYRMANEVPTVLMIGIVILVIVKPF